MITSLEDGEVSARTKEGSIKIKDRKMIKGK
jgi:hypothetical protein